MAGLLDLFSGRSSDIYGEGLLTPEQRGGLGNIGLLALAGKLGQLAGPSFSPVPDFGAALGQAAGAYGASQEGAGTAALNAILTAQKGRKLQQELDYSKQLGPVLAKLAGDWPGAGGGTAATPETGSTGGGTAAPLGAGGGGGPVKGGYSHADMVQLALNAGFPPDKADTMAAIALGESSGNPNAYNGKGENSYGLTQINADAHGPVAREALDPKRAFELAYKISKGGTDFSPWTVYKTGAYKQYLPQGGAASTAAAPADAVRVPYNYGAPSGGLLTPNPLSDADPIAGIPRPAAAPQAAAGPLPIYAGTGPEEALTLSRIAPQARSVEARQAQLALANAYADALQNGFRGTIQDFVASRGTSGGGGPLAAPPGAGGDPIMSVTSADQAGGGDAPAAPARAPLPVMGPTGVELPPMQGPLAAPAPAAAAPAAAGPGLLSPPGAPQPALPRGANPAYDAYLRNLALAGALSEAAGLKNVFGPLTDALKASPAYQAELERAKARIGVEFAGPKTTAEEEAKSKFVGSNAAAVAAAQDPYLKGQELFKSQMKMLGEGRVWDAEAGTFVSAPGYAKTVLDQEIAKAEGAKSQETTTKVVRGTDGRDYTVTVPLVEYLKELRDNLQKNQQAGVPQPTGTAVRPGQISPQPVSTPEELKSQEIDLKRLEEKRVTAESSRLAIQNANDIRQLIEKGVVLGAGSDNRTQLLKLGQLLGLTGKDENDLIANTETYIARQGAELKDALKGLGPPISNVDVQTAGAIAGRQNMTAQGLLELMQIKEKYHRQALSDYNEMAKTAPQSRFERAVKEPPTYGAKTATGPNGERMWEKSPNNWVPF